MIIFIYFYINLYPDKAKLFSLVFYLGGTHFPKFLPLSLECIELKSIKLKQIREKKNKTTIELLLNYYCQTQTSISTS